MTDNALKLKKYLNKYNNCTRQDKKQIYKQKIKKYRQLGGAKKNKSSMDLPEEITNMFGSYVDKYNTEKIYQRNLTLLKKENIYQRSLTLLRTETTEKKYEIFLSHYVNNLKSYKKLKKSNEKQRVVTKEMLDAMYGDYDFYKYEDYVNLRNKSFIENLYLYSEQKVLKLRSIPGNIKKIILNFPNLIRIEDRFLRRCTGLVDIDLSGLVELISIGDEFLSGCSRLTEVDVSGLAGLITIGDDFLSGCGDLDDIDLSGLRGLVAIGDRFLFGCGALVEVTVINKSSISYIIDEMGLDFVMITKI